MDKLKKQARYEMHKYWGKKPPEQLKSLLDEYSKEGDIVLDPFAGYGVFIGEAFINKRNAIANDLNPAACFIQKQLLVSEIDIEELANIASNIIHSLENVDKFWNTISCPLCNEDAKIIVTLRHNNNNPTKCKIKCSCTKRMIEHQLSNTEISKLLKKEKEEIIPEHPVSSIMHNSRISAKKNMNTDDLFTIRTLSMHISLLNKINELEDKVYRDLLLLAFTANLANCSRLVPPIKSRGDMAPGTWMTGFYVGETYLENSVLHYFKNRVVKLISGKKDFLKQLNDNSIKKSDYQASSIAEIKKNKLNYLLNNADTKKLPYPNNSIDYIFTDPPYGDSVPYFEQSIIWNTWLNLSVDYTNEVVISDSKERNKKSQSFSEDMELCISEIYRVLKINKYFSITFHSISGAEWYAILNGCLKNNFILHKMEWLTQKTFTPRQLNRTKTVKGDMLITFKKGKNKNKHILLSKEETESLIIKITEKLLHSNNLADTNTIYMALLQEFFSEHLIIENINIINILTNNFSINEAGLWYI